MDRRALPGEVVDDGEGAKPSVALEAIRDEVDGPPLVRVPAMVSVDSGGR